ncbi:zf-HC2 domain-containing protein [Paenibacillus faecalis]|uniref:zf-HC2 domain-containing protein n=1 Tax=Paenibacillus faecalis TaxID=2079532 RepID=UPI000D10BC8B|nr:zf-HC2 domain-containing protein [Paenibacillus faecalis]
MNCQEVVEYMHRYLDQDLDPEETAQMYRHIAVCPVCAEQFNVLKALSRNLEDLPAVIPPYSLVDSILPQLDAIDRARQEQIKQETDEGPAVMVPELKRKKRSGSWWGSIAGRTAIGTAAAVVILGVAIYNYEPKMLSDAELPIEEAVSSSPDTGSSETQELPDNESSSGNSDTGNKNENQLDINLFGAEDDRNDPEEEQTSPDEKTPSNMDSALAPEAQSDGKSEEGSPDTETSHRKDTMKDTDNSVSVPVPEADKPSAPQQDAVPEAQTPKDSQTTQKPSTNSTPMENRENAFDYFQKFSIASMPEHWTSPDGLHSVSLEMDQLVVYRNPSATDQVPEVLRTVPVKGEWIGGEWSEDSKSFTYKVLVDQKEVKHVLNVQSTVDSSKPGDDKAEKPATSEETDQTDIPEKTEQTDKTESKTTP